MQCRRVRVGHVQELRFVAHPDRLSFDLLSGDYCSMIRVRASSMQHLESFIERIGQHGEMRSSVVLSTQFEGRSVEPFDDDSRDVTRSAGWSRS